VDIVIHTVDALEVGDSCERFLAVGAGAGFALITGYGLEGVEDDVFDELPERHAFEFGERLEDAHHMALHAHAELDAFDCGCVSVGHDSPPTVVHVYHCPIIS
jgi:hypothetical protein